NARGIFYPFQKQSVRWNVRSRIPSVPAPQDRHKFFVAKPAASNLQKSADNSTNHSPQKTVRRNAEDNFISFFHPAGFANVANKMIYIGFNLAETLKIMNAYQ